MQHTLTHDAAQCPVHPQVAARGVCGRCGNFVCVWCTEQGQHAECLACRERGGVGFRFTRDAWTLSELARHSWVTFKRCWVTLVPALFIVSVTFMMLIGAQAAGLLAVFGVPTTQASFDMKRLLFSNGLSMALNILVTPMVIGYIELCLTALRGRPLELGTLFVPYARFVRVAMLVAVFSAIGLAINLLFHALFAGRSVLEVGATTWIWVLLATPPFLYVSISSGFAYAVVADDPGARPLDALKRSWRIASGKHWSILSVWIISGLAVTFGLMMCLLPSIAVMPWASLLWSATYLALATPTPVRVPAQVA